MINRIVAGQVGLAVDEDAQLVGGIEKVGAVRIGDGARPDNVAWHLAWLTPGHMLGRDGRLCHIGPGIDDNGRGDRNRITVLSWSLSPANSLIFDRSVALSRDLRVRDVEWIFVMGASGNKGGGCDRHKQ